MTIARAPSTLRAIAFDLGNTLVEYYHLRDFPQVLDEVIGESERVLTGIHSTTLLAARQAADNASMERDDHRVVPLMTRLAEVFGLTEPLGPEVENTCSKAFLDPILKRGRLYVDTHETLAELRSRGYKLAIVSNTPWGSPSALWREEVARHGLLDAIDVAVFCEEVGWRKPAPKIFEVALNMLNVAPEEALFVGDHLDWDVRGAFAAGMHAVLIDREQEYESYQGPTIKSLSELLQLV